MDAAQYAYLKANPTKNVLFLGQNTTLTTLSPILSAVRPSSLMRNFSAVIITSEKVRRCDRHYLAWLPNCPRRHRATFNRSAMLVSASRLSARRRNDDDGPRILLLSMLSSRFHTERIIRLPFVATKLIKSRVLLPPTELIILL